MKTFIKSIFSEKECNIGRQSELDTAKGVAIIFMVICHTVTTLSLQKESTAYTIGNIIFGSVPAAPVFMVCMGIGICYSCHNDSASHLKRGIMLFGTAYLLNFFRDFLPNLLCFAVRGSYDKEKLLYWLLNVDILQFAGLVFMVLALFRRLKISDIFLLPVSAVLSLIGGLVQGTSTGSIVSDSFFGLIWGTGSVSAFAFLNWLIFPCFGLVYGRILKHCCDKERLYKYQLIPAGIVTLLYLALYPVFGEYYLIFNYFWMGLWDAVFSIAVVCLLFSVYYFLAQKLNTKILNTLKRFSSSINTIYCIHWCMIGWAAMLLIRALRIETFPAWGGYPVAVIILTLSDRIADWWLHKAKPVIQKRKESV